MNARIILAWFLLACGIMAGCSKDLPDQPAANRSPRTFLWLFPDSTIAQGNSRQRIRWWGEDPDGIVRGYLFATGKNVKTGDLYNDTLGWVWTTKNDSLVAFPLLVKQDTFSVAVRAVDNTFTSVLPEQAIIRLVPFPYWDRNGDGVFDPGDVQLGSLAGALDAVGASLAFPLLNQPPSVVFAQSPLDPSVTMQQPETTFTAATFAWVGSDPDGDQTIANYEIALNDTSSPSSWFFVPGNTRLVSLVVPRGRSDTATGEVAADVYSGTFASTRRLLGSIPHLRLDALNRFYLRARDVAGDVSLPIQLPSATGKWFVRKPKGRVLVISDYIVSDSGEAVRLYGTVLTQMSGGRFAAFDVLNIGRGLTAQQKKDGKYGAFVPPFIDPGFLYTLHLYDAVIWFTDQYPSLGVAQYPLFQYVRDPSHRGKVVFTTMFESSIDPRGALRDFAPIDSISSVDLNASRLLPTAGDTRLPAGYLLAADAGDPAYPDLKFGSIPLRVNYSVFMRAIYRREDARYIYHMQEDTRLPRRYVYTPGLADLKDIAALPTAVIACGNSGTVLSSTDLGTTWEQHRGLSAAHLNGLDFADGSAGWIVGDGGTILATTDAGANWTNRSVIAFENLLSVDFLSSSTGVIVGTQGLLIRTTNGGTSWNSPNSRTVQALRSVRFADANVGIAVGDSGVIIRTLDAGATWTRMSSPTVRPLSAVSFANPVTAYAVGAAGTMLQSTDTGRTWAVLPPLTASDLRSVRFGDAQNGALTGANGLLYATTDGGTSWVARSTGIVQGAGNGQILTAVSFGASGQMWAVGTGGILIASFDGGTSWDTQPKLPLNVGVIDGIGVDGHRSFLFLGLPLHVLDGDGTNVRSLLEHVFEQEFGL
jgi:photosystem II stability/assembly factor-like uncharacterized protein